MGTKGVSEEQAYAYDLLTKRGVVMSRGLRIVTDSHISLHKQETLGVKSRICAVLIHFRVHIMNERFGLDARGIEYNVLIISYWVLLDRVTLLVVLSSSVRDKPTPIISVCELCLILSSVTSLS